MSRTATDFPGRARARARDREYFQKQGIIFYGPNSPYTQCPNLLTTFIKLTRYRIGIGILSFKGTVCTVCVAYNCVFSTK